MSELYLYLQLLVLLFFRHVYSQSFSRLQKLIAADGAANDYFGAAVTQSGTNLLIGAFCDDDKTTDAGTYNFNSSICFLKSYIL